MGKFIIILLFVFWGINANSQTVIEMAYPSDANLILLEVDNEKDADIAVYKTDDKKLYQQWSLKWKFKKWGFSNFSVYITKDEHDPLLKDPDTNRDIPFNGKIYFTDDPSKARYITPGFRLEGVFKKTASNDEKK